MTKCPIEAKTEADNYEFFRDELTPFDGESFDGEFRFTGDGKRASFVCREGDVTITWIGGAEFILTSPTRPTKVVNLAPRGGLYTLAHRLRKEATVICRDLTAAYVAEYDGQGASIAA